MTRFSSFNYLFCFIIFCLGCTHSSDRNPTLLTIKPLSFTNNPDGNWQVGYSRNKSLASADFISSTLPDTLRPVPLWHPSDTLYYPYTGQNIDTSLVADSSKRWAARPGEFVMEGSNLGQYAILRFIVSLTGNYRVTAVFEGVHIGISTTDVHVLKNDDSLFSDFVSGYGGDPRFFTVTGIRPSVKYTGELSLKAGDLLSFAVGYGQNETFYNDTTGLLLDIRKTD